MENLRISHPWPRPDAAGIYVPKYKAGTLENDAKWTQIIGNWTYKKVGKPIKDKVDDLVLVKENKCCWIFCCCSCTWICWFLCPGKIGHFVAKCFHFFGYFLSLFLSLPLVPVNKIVEAFWQIRLHINEKARREATEEEKNDPDESQRTAFSEHF